MWVVALLWLGCNDGKETGVVCDTENETCAPGECEEEEGPEMLPGANCQACHTAGIIDDIENDDDDEGESDEESEDDVWSFAGTLYADRYGSEPLQGATIRVTDAEGSVHEVTTNRVGNFYSDAALVFPIFAEVEKDGEIVSMAPSQTTGACNSCHNCSGQAGGKMYGPMATTP